MATLTLLRLHYFNGASILVTEEEGVSYSLHVNANGVIERKTVPIGEPCAKARLAALLITAERYHLHQESIARGIAPEVLRWDERYIQLTQFIESLSPGYLFRWGTIRKDKTEKTADLWVTHFNAEQINYNVLRAARPVFRLYHQLEGETGHIRQWFEWIEDKERFLAGNPIMEKIVAELAATEYLACRTEWRQDAPKLFDDFGDVLEE